jgi:hypothetical protein
VQRSWSCGALGLQRELAMEEEYCGGKNGGAKKGTESGGGAGRGEVTG